MCAQVRYRGAELPGGGDEPPVVRRAAQVLDVGVAADPAGGQAGGGEGLGGVLGDVVGDGGAVERLAGAGELAAVADDPGVGLRAEAEPDGLVLVLDDDGGGSGGQADGVA
jgi:hypothetical protein